MIIQFGNFLLFLSSKISSKASERISHISEFMDAITDKNEAEQRVWFHTSSMGEFEQAKPVIEEIKRISPQVKIYCSFFSPSGYTTQKYYRYADYIFYMPVDTVSEARYTIRKVNPDVAVFVRYDTWLNHLIMLRQSDIPSLLICATRPGNHKLTEYPVVKHFTQLLYSQFTKIYTVGKLHTQFFNELQVGAEIISSSDTRIDRIAKQVDFCKNSPIMPYSFSEGVFTMVAGSTWEKDEEIIIEAIKIINKDAFNLRVIFVPHEPTYENVERIRLTVGNTVEFSELDMKHDFSRTMLEGKHIIVDSIGKLLSLYANADIAYVGNGFGKTVHSTSEPAGYGIPIATGPNIHKSPDAVELYQAGALTIVNNAQELADWIYLMYKQPKIRKQKGNLARKFIDDSIGATAFIAREVLKSLDEHSKQAQKS